jgi:choice-of-anchor B domain-containing protein
LLETLWKLSSVVQKGRFVSESRRFVAIAAIGLFAAACGERKPDHDAPVFAGLQSAVKVAPGTAHIAWNAASDRSGPVTYLVYVGDGSGAENFAAPPTATTTGTELDVSGLEVSPRASYFIVRARDSKGNTDANVVEQSVTFADNRLRFRGHYPIGDFETSDVAVNSAGNLVAVGGFISSPQVRAYVFDVTDPATPVLYTTIYGPGRSTDVEIRGTRLYVSTEEDSTVPPSGVYIYDISDPFNISQTPIGTVTGAGLGQCHTIWLEDTTMYCASSDDGKMHIIDVADAANPIPLGSVGIPGGRIHDMYVKDGFAVGCFLNDGFAFIDVSNPMQPVLQQRVQYSPSFTHNAWPTPDLHYLYTTDELPFTGHLRIWDIQDHNHVVQVGDWLADPGANPHAIVHNVQIVDGYAWVSWYEAGVQVLDIADPVHPRLVGLYDTWPSATASDFNGAWGVAPKPPYLYVSDLDTGFYVLKLINVP